MVRTVIKIAGALVAVPLLLLIALRLAAMVRERGAEPPPGLAMAAKGR